MPQTWKARLGPILGRGGPDPAERSGAGVLGGHRGGEAEMAVPGAIRHSGGTDRVVTYTEELPSVSRQAL